MRKDVLRQSLYLTQLFFASLQCCLEIRGDRVHVHSMNLGTPVILVTRVASSYLLGVKTAPFIMQPLMSTAGWSYGSGLIEMFMFDWAWQCQSRVICFTQQTRLSPSTGWKDECVNSYCSHECRDSLITVEIVGLKKKNGH